MSIFDAAVESTRRCSRLLPVEAIIPQLGHLGLLENPSSYHPRFLRDEQRRLCGDREQTTGSDCIGGFSEYYQLYSLLLLLKIFHLHGESGNSKNR